MNITRGGGSPRRLRSALLLGAAALLLPSCTEQVAVRSDALVGPVTHVRDGDTIEVAGRPVRLQGLTCDERGTPMGDAATETTSRLVAGNKIACDLSGVLRS